VPSSLSQRTGKRVEEKLINRIPLIFSGREILTRNFRPGFPPPIPTQIIREKGIYYTV